MNRKRIFVGVLAGLALSAVAGAQFMQVVKILGVGAAVQKFGPQINGAINKLSGHKDAGTTKTKVVPILSAGINSRKAIGAAQVLGPKSLVDKVKAVAQLDQDLFGEIKIRAMVPVSSDKDLSNLKRVEGVGISGIVDLRL